MGNGFLLPAITSGFGRGLEGLEESLGRMAEREMKREQMRQSGARLQLEQATPKHVQTTPTGEVQGLVFDPGTGRFTMKPFGKVPVQAEESIQGGYIWRRDPATGQLKPVARVPEQPMTGFQKEELDIKRKRLAVSEAQKTLDREFKEKQLASQEDLKRETAAQTFEWRKMQQQWQEQREKDRMLDKERDRALKLQIANMTAEQRREAAEARKSSPEHAVQLREAQILLKAARERGDMGNFMGQQLQLLEKHLPKASGWGSQFLARKGSEWLTGLPGMQDVANAEGYAKTVLAREDRTFAGLTGRLPFAMIQATEGMLYSPGFPFERNLKNVGETHARVATYLEITAKDLRESAIQLRTSGDLALADSVARQAQALEGHSNRFMANAQRIANQLSKGGTRGVPPAGPMGAEERLRQKFGAPAGR